MGAAVWEAAVSDPGEFGSRSTSYLVTLRTTRAEYGGPAGAEGSEGGGAGGGGGAAGAGAGPEGEGAGPEPRVLQCRRRYSDFEKLHKALKKEGLGVPPLPSKFVFGKRFSEKVVAERMAFFNELLACVAADPRAQGLGVVVDFLLRIASPDYAEVQDVILERAREILAVPDSEWKTTVSEGTVQVALRSVPGSSICSVRNVVSIARPWAKVAELYQQTDVWKNWAAEMQFRRVETIPEPHGFVTAAQYAMPVVENRDTCTFAVQSPAASHPTNPDTACFFAGATSIEHPLVPLLRGCVRAEVKISVTLIEPHGEHECRYTSIVHSDPKGQVPAAVVNKVVGMSGGSMHKMKAFMEASIPSAKPDEEFEML